MKTKIGIKDIRKDLVYYLNFFDDDIKKIIDKQENKETYIQYFFKYSIKSLSDLLCPRCKKNKRNIKDKWCYCSKKCQVTTMKGKKRPEHSLWVKDAFKKGIYEKFRFYTNPELNKMSFKRKRLENLGIIKNTDILGEDKLIKIYNKLLSDIQKTKEFKCKSLITFIKNTKYIFTDIFKESILSDLTDDIILEANINEIEKWYKVKNSIKSCVSMQNNPLMGNSSCFKRKNISGLNYNIRGLSFIIVKSTYEENYVNFFENNKILWDYENIKIKSKNGYYIPDFLFKIEDIKYILEVKGTFFRTSIEDYCSTKLINIIKYCKENNMKFLFSFKENIESIEDILKYEVLNDPLKEISSFLK